MTHPLTPREAVEYWLDLALTTGAKKQDFNMSEAVSGILTALASGSGDHAELARLAEAALATKTEDRNGYVNWRGVEARTRFEKAANPAIVLSILAENAALRAMAEKIAGDSMNQTDKLLAMHDRATEAERKLAEAVGLLRVTLGDLDRRNVTAETANRIDHFISKEAERG